MAGSWHSSLNPGKQYNPALQEATMETNMSEPEFRARVLKELSETKQMVSRLNTAVLGDEDAEIMGLAQRTKANEDYIEKDKAFKNKVAGGLFLAVPLFGMVVEWVKKHWPF